MTGGRRWCRTGRVPSRKPWSGRSRRIVLALIEACEDRDAAAIARVLRRDVVLTIDSGGILPLSSRATGRAEVAQLLLDLLARFPRVRLEPGHVNGRPGVLLTSGGRVVGVMNGARRGRGAQELWIVANPEKLRHWNAL